VKIDLFYIDICVCILFLFLIEKKFLYTYFYLCLDLHPVDICIVSENTKAMERHCPNTKVIGEAFVSLILLTNTCVRAFVYIQGLIWDYQRTISC
jgi:hypothetical protein